VADHETGTYDWIRYRGKVFNRLFSAFVAFWRSLLKKPVQPQKPSAPDVNEVAQQFYFDLLDAEQRRKR